MSKLATETLEKGVKYVVLTTKASEGRRSHVFIVNSEHNSHVFIDNVEYAFVCCY